MLLILIVLALYRGFSSTGQTFKLLPGDLWVVQQGTTDPFHSLSLLDSERLASVRNTEGVAVTVPVLSRQMEFDAGNDVSSARFMALQVPAGASLPDDIRRDFLPPQGTVVIDNTLSRKTGLGAGESLVIGGEPFVIDHVRPAAGESLQQFAFMQFDDAERVYGIHDVVNYAMVIVAPGRDADEVAANILASARTRGAAPRPRGCPL